MEDGTKVSAVERAKFYLDRGTAGSMGSDLWLFCKAVVEMDEAIKMHLNPMNDRQEAHIALMKSIGVMGLDKF